MSFFSGPSFLSRLLRPFTSSTNMSVSAGASGAAATIPEGAEKATIAAGCFWGVEHIYRKHFGGKGLYDARVGYIGGDSSNPSYRAVCSGTTGRTLPRHLLPPVLSPLPALRLTPHTLANRVLQTPKQPS